MGPGGAIAAPGQAKGCEGFDGAPPSLAEEYADLVSDEFRVQAKRRDQTLSEADIATLPDAARRFLLYTRAVGQPRVQNARIEFDVEMIRKGQALPAPSVQYNFFAEPARIFFVRARLFPIGQSPPRVPRPESHNGCADSLALNIVDAAGSELSATETVTLFSGEQKHAPSSATVDCLDGRNANGTKRGVHPGKEADSHGNGHPNKGILQLQERPDDADAPRP